MLVAHSNDAEAVRAVGRVRNSTRLLFGLAVAVVALIILRQLLPASTDSRLTNALGLSVLGCVFGGVLVYLKRDTRKGVLAEVAEKCVVLKVGWLVRWEYWLVVARAGVNPSLDGLYDYATKRRELIKHLGEETVRAQRRDGE